VCCISVYCIVCIIYVWVYGIWSCIIVLYYDVLNKCILAHIDAEQLASKSLQNDMCELIQAIGIQNYKGAS